MTERAITRPVRSEADRKSAMALLASRKPPFTVSLVSGAKHRTLEQNRLQRLWVNEAAEQTGEPAEEIRGYCKLRYGVPILRNEDEEFREAYDRVIRPMDYEIKLQLMMVPFDFPVTRLMSTGQKTRYLNDIYHHLTVDRGCELTDPIPKGAA